MVDDLRAGERIIWKGYTSWRHFGWLYFFSVWTGVRGALLRWFEIPGWELWVVGGLVLLGVVVMVRYWVQYVLTSMRVIVRNGFSGKKMEDLEWNELSNLEIHQGPLGSFLNIGTLAMESQDREKRVRVRGVRDPEVLARKIYAGLPKASPVFSA